MRIARAGWALRRGLVVWAAVVVLVLSAAAGCGNDDGGSGGDGDGEASTQTSVPPTAEAESEATTPESPAEPSDGADDCLVGTWTLDLVDYTTQAEAFLVGLGIPLESLAMSGEQVLEFRPDGAFLMRSSVVTDAVVAGQSLSATYEGTGGGAWDASGEQVDVSEWLWGIEPAPATAGAMSVPFIDPSTGFQAACSAQAMELSTPGAPLVGSFIRVS